MTLNSFKINLDTGRWSDFATGDRGWQCKRRSGRGFAGPRPALELRLGLAVAGEPHPERIVQFANFRCRIHNAVDVSGY